MNSFSLMKKGFLVKMNDFAVRIEQNKHIINSLDQLYKIHAQSILNSVKK